MIPVTAEVSLFLRQEKEAQEALSAPWFILLTSTPCDRDSSANRGKNRFRLDGEASAITIIAPLQLSLSSKWSIIYARSPIHPTLPPSLLKFHQPPASTKNPILQSVKPIFKFLEKFHEKIFTSKFFLFLVNPSLMICAR